MDTATFRATTVVQASNRHWLLLIVFAACIVAAPHVFGLLNISPPGLSENRALAQLPEFPSSPSKIRDATKGLENYAQDHFPPRAHLISLLNLGRYQLGYSTLKRVIVGRDGWLFYNDGNSIRQHLGTRRLTRDQIKSWVAGFNQRIDWASKHNAKFYMLIGPQKPSVYPDKMPSWLRPAQQTDVDRFLKAAREKGIDRIIYPRERLIAQRAVQPVYGPFDTHWNGIGAYTAYTELMNRIAVDDPELKPFPLSSFTPSTPVGWQVPRDLALMLGIADHIEQPWVTYVTWPQHDEARTIFLQSNRRDWTAPQIWETDTKNERTLLLIRDSFSTDLLPFLKPHFKRIIVVHNGDGFFRQDLIEKYKPDTVILEVIETGARHAMSPLVN